MRKDQSQNRGVSRKEEINGIDVIKHMENLIDWNKLGMMEHLGK